MNTRILLIPVLCMFAAAIGLQAQDKSGKATKAAPTETELELAMEEINFAYRRLNRQVGDASKNADSLKQVATIQKHANAAMKLEPMRKKEVPPAQQAKFMADYQAKMKEFIGHVGQVESALKAGKNDQAAAALKTLKQDQEEGHEMFRKKKSSDKKAEPAKK